MNATFIEPFAEAVKSTLAMMASIELTQQPQQDKADSVARGELSSVIGMVSPQLCGSMAITFDKPLSLAMMQNMLGETHGEINADVADMIGEMTNIICGSAKAALSEQGYEFNMATPVVITGENHVIHHHVEGPSTITTFISPKGNAYLEVCFDK
ncbi:chemotaxis protein CheX [Glaciecola sp. XM2]|uniref:chemotaxis protein CheX n=1 Tax=Glaciecola sp. XM2 TaxID=1914931 RepID=UPI001BDEBE43|nr:chemotaxis protein CheX [Glaciecola sp. XM2]MBT1449967.1 chemotaxis protein CheX [Glaciecola sp. XM2]